MRTKYHLRSGISVIHRPFERHDSVRCSQILLRNFEPLKTDMGSDEWEKHFGKVYTPSNMLVLAKQRDYHVVTIPNELVIGLMGFVPDFGHEAEMANLSVDPDYHGKGIGKLLVALGVLTKMREGCVEFFAYSSRQSKPILCQLGASETKGRPHDYGGRVTTLYLQVDDGLERKARLMLETTVLSQAAPETNHS